MKIASRFACPLGTLPLAALAVFLTLLTPTLNLAASPNAYGQNKVSFSDVIVIGDSLSDTGRTLVALGSPPIPAFVNGRLSNGPLWIDYLAPQVSQAYNPLANFSWAGAHTGRRNAYGPLPGMLDELDELLAEKHLDSHALYVVFGGSNDFSRLLSVPPEDPMVVIPQAVDNLVSIVRQLRARGAKHIVVVNVPNIGLTPRARLAGPIVAAQATLLSVVFNSLLDTALDAVDKKLIRVSAFNILSAITANPAVFGFTNVTDMGLFAGNADTYLFWDDLHPTTRAHQIVAAVIYDALETAGLLKENAHPASK